MRFYVTNKYKLLPFILKVRAFLVLNNKFTVILVCFASTVLGGMFITIQRRKSVDKYDRNITFKVYSLLTILKK